MVYDKILEELLKTCQFIASRGLSPATGGNFSVRSQGEKLWISASGKDKSQLTINDFVECDFNAKWIQGEGKPSAETHLHGMVYHLSLNTFCVLHTHSVAATVLSMRHAKAGMIRFEQYEMQKTIQGFQSHEEVLELPIFANDQDIPALAQRIKEKWPQVAKAQGLLVAGHGLYSWGESIFAAKRHMEGLEFLLQCELAKGQLK